MTQNRDYGPRHSGWPGQLYCDLADPADLPLGRLLRILGGQSHWITAALREFPAPHIRGEWEE